MTETRRSLLQKTVLAASAAALVAKKATAADANATPGTPAWQHLFPPASAMKGSKPQARKSTP